jgi:hypothetical protein
VLALFRETVLWDIRLYSPAEVHQRKPNERTVVDVLDPFPRPEGGCTAFLEDAAEISNHMA